MSAETIREIKAQVVVGFPFWILVGATAWGAISWFVAIAIFACLLVFAQVIGLEPFATDRDGGPAPQPVAHVTAANHSPKPVKPAKPTPINVGAMTAIKGPYKPAPRSVHFDECVGDRHGDLFERHGIDVTRTRDVGLAGESDAEQMSFAYGEHRVIITYDSDFIILNARGLPHCGVLRAPNNASPEAILKTYRSIWG